MSINVFQFKLIKYCTKIIITLIKSVVIDKIDILYKANPKLKLTFLPLLSLTIWFKNKPQLIKAIILIIIKKVFMLFAI